MAIVIIVFRFRMNNDYIRIATPMAFEKVLVSGQPLTRFTLSSSRSPVPSLRRPSERVSLEDFVPGLTLIHFQPVRTCRRCAAGAVGFYVKFELTFR